MSPRSSVPQLCILLVENHPDTATCLRIYLEESGHAVTTVESMQAALAVVPERDFEVALIDIGLPDGTGWELLRQAGFSEHVFAIAMSGFGMNADRQRSEDAGFRYHLLKPFDPDELDRLLAEAAREKAER